MGAGGRQGRGEQMDVLSSPRRLPPAPAGGAGRRNSGSRKRGLLFLYFQAYMGDSENSLCVEKKC